MVFKLEPRAVSSRVMIYQSPIIAVFLTLLAGMVMFRLMGTDPLQALEAFFIEPISKQLSNNFYIKSYIHNFPVIFSENKILRDKDSHLFRKEINKNLLVVLKEKFIPSSWQNNTNTIYKLEQLVIKFQKNYRVRYLNINVIFLKFNPVRYLANDIFLKNNGMRY